MKATRTTEGFTLTELVLAVSITAVIGLAAAGMTAAVSRANSATSQMRDSLDSARVAMASLDSTLRKAQLVTAATSTSLWLWMGDANDNGMIDLDELLLVQYDSATQTVTSSQVQFPADMAVSTKDALNVGLKLEDVNTVAKTTAVANQAVYTSYKNLQTLGTGVRSFQAIWPAGQAPPATKSLLIRMTVGPLGQQITLTDSVNLRADATACVQSVGSHTCLNMNAR